MNKNVKAILLMVSIAVACIMGGCSFNFMSSEEVTEIATYKSSDGEYLLVFEQIGEIAGPFGPADVRMTLINHTGEMIDRVSDQIFNDGGNAGKHNVVSVSWNHDAVVVILRGSEMKDKEVVIPYHKS